jgi:glycosyltransferase involved in cell wall biosynthesis
VRILHVTPFYEPFRAYGGMVRCSSALCRALAVRGHEVTVATALLEPGPPADEQQDGVRVRRFAGPALPARLLFPLARGLRGFLDAELPRTDVVHLHGHRNGLAAVTWWAAQAAGKPVVLLPNGTYPRHGQRVAVKAVYDLAVGERIVRDAAALVAVSEAEARDLPRPAVVVPNGVEPCGCAASGGPRTRPRLLFVGTDRPQKRWPALLPLLEALPEAELHVVGRFGSSAAAALARLSSRLRFSGVLAGDALATAYADADLLVHPAVGEAFGLVPFEAAFAGTAAVVAGGHGCGEWFARAGGCVVPPDDPGALLEAVRRRLERNDVGAEETRRVGAFARERLTWESTAASIEVVYESVRKPAAERAS